MTHDFGTDAIFDSENDKFFIYMASNPQKLFEVRLLDDAGEPTDIEDDAVGGVVKLADECFTTFMFPRESP